MWNQLSPCELCWQHQLSINETENQVNAGFTEDIAAKAVLYFTSFVDKGLLCVSHSYVADIYPEISVQVTSSAPPPSLL